MAPSGSQSPQNRPQGRQHGRNMAPKTAQKPSKRHQRPPKSPPRAPKMTSKTPPRALLVRNHNLNTLLNGFYPPKAPQKPPKYPKNPSQNRRKIRSKCSSEIPLILTLFLYVFHCEISSELEPYFNEFLTVIWNCESFARTICLAVADSPMSKKHCKTHIETTFFTVAANWCPMRKVVQFCFSDREKSARK